MAMPRRPPRHHNLNSSAGLSTAASALILSADRPFAGGRPNWPPLEARSFAPHLPRTAAGRTHYKRLDVTDESAVSALAAELSNVAGIIHAAGFVEPCPFGELSEARIASTFEPKAMGAEHLKTHFGGPHLEFMLLYASSAAWLGTLSRGLAHYAAANAYLEAFAAEQTREGATTIAISWPPWNGIGRVRAEAASGYFSRLGVATMSPEEADLVLDSLNVLDRSQIVLCAIDRAYYVCRGVDRDLLRDLDDGPVSAAPAAVTTPYEAPHDVLETRLAEVWQEVLGIARVGRHDSFFSLGGDSIKAATLLNRLRQHMTDTISIVALFEAPTIAHLAAYLRENHPDCALAIENASVAQEPMIVATERAADLLIRIDELGSEEVEVLIQQRSETHVGNTLSHLQDLYRIAGGRLGWFVMRAARGDITRVRETPAAANVRWNLDYERDFPKGERLYNAAKKRAWDPQNDIDWSQGTRPDEGLIADEHWVAHAMGLADLLGEEDRVQLNRRSVGWVMSQLLHGEQGSLLLVSQLCDMRKDIDGKLFLASQAMDEARHIEVFKRYLGGETREVGAIDVNIDQDLVA